jgi:hypothetical protein
MPVWSGGCDGLVRRLRPVRCGGTRCPDGVVECQMAETDMASEGMLQEGSRLRPSVTHHSAGTTIRFVCDELIHATVDKYAEGGWCARSEGPECGGLEVDCGVNAWPQAPRAVLSESRKGASSSHQVEKDQLTLAVRSSCMD